MEKDCQNGWPAISIENVQSVVKSRMGRVVNELPRKVDGDRLYALGNAVVPPVAEWLGHRIIEADRST